MTCRRRRTVLMYSTPVFCVHVYLSFQDLQSQMVDPSDLPLVERLTQELQTLRENLVEPDVDLPAGGPDLRGHNRPGGRQPEFGGGHQRSMGQYLWEQQEVVLWRHLLVEGWHLWWRLTCRTTNTVEDEWLLTLIVCFFGFFCMCWSMQLCWIIMILCTTVLRLSTISVIFLVALSTHFARPSSYLPYIGNFLKWKKIKQI